MLNCKINQNNNRFMKIVYTTPECRALDLGVKDVLCFSGDMLMGIDKMSTQDVTGSDYDSLY